MCSTDNSEQGVDFSTETQNPDGSLNNDSRLELLAYQSIEVVPLSRADVLGRLEFIRKNTPGLRNWGVSSLTDLEDRIILGRTHENTLIARSLHEARVEIQQLKETLSSVPGALRMGYITGGLEPFLHHLIMVESLIIPPNRMNALVIGIEDPKYVRKKGREPIFTIHEKLYLWEHLASTIPAYKAIIFAIPSLPDWINPKDYYDWICKYLGCYQDPSVWIIGADDDPREIRESRKARAVLGNYLEVGVGYPLSAHTREVVI